MKESCFKAFNSFQSLSKRFSTPPKKSFQRLFKTIFLKTFHSLSKALQDNDISWRNVKILSILIQWAFNCVPLPKEMSKSDQYWYSGLLTVGPFQCWKLTQLFLFSLCLREIEYFRHFTKWIKIRGQFQWHRSLKRSLIYISMPLSLETTNLENHLTTSQRHR